MEVPQHFSPRDYQQEFLSEAPNYWYIVLEWARRAGKGLTTYAYAVQRMVEEPMGVIIVYPTAEQGYKAFWNNIENDGFRTIEHMPAELIASQTNSKDNMSMILKNGSTLDLVGSNANPEKLRGNNVKLYIFSEFVDIDSGVLGIIEPIIINNGGQIIVESTPKMDGISGSTFIKMFKAAEKDPEQYASKIPATRYMTKEQLERARQSVLVKYGDDFMFRQEYLLDEGAALATSYYGNLLTRMKKAGRIGNHPYNKTHPVFTAWDLGSGAGTTAIAFWQYYDKKLRIIDAHETHSIGDEAIVKFVTSKPYNYGWHFLPHDGARADSDDIQRIAKMRNYGLINASLLTRKDKEKGILRAIDLLADKNTTIHEPMCSDAIDKLKLYKRMFNKFTGDYEGPEHKSASHISDTVRYIGEAIDQAFDKDTGKFYYTYEETVSTRDSEDLVTNLDGYDDNWDF